MPGPEHLQAPPRADEGSPQRCSPQIGGLRHLRQGAYLLPLFRQAQANLGEYARIVKDGDLDVDINDVMLVASRWRTSCYNLGPDNNLDTPNYEGCYDLDHDCDILVVKHWEETC